MKKLLIVLCLTLLAIMGLENSNVRASDNDYLVSLEEQVKVFEGNDITFNYVVENGVITNLSNNIDEESYVITDNKIIIKEEFIRNIINDNPERSMLIFSYLFEASDGVNFVIGYLFIDLQSGKELYTNHYPTVENPNKHDYMLNMKVIPRYDLLSYKNIKKLEK